MLVVNQFYRVKKPPIGEQGSQTPIPTLLPLAQALNETTHTTDAKAFIAWLDGQPSVAKNRKIGTQGYCMGGPMAFRTSAAVPDRVGAVASFHGGGLVTGQPNSPHLQASKTKAQFLIAIASNDDQRAPNEKDVLKETFEKANLPAEIEVYGGAHGWCPPDSARLQRTGCRKGLDASACAVRQGAGLVVTPRSVRAGRTRSALTVSPRGAQVPSPLPPRAARQPSQRTVRLPANCRESSGPGCPRSPRQRQGRG